MIKFGQFQFVEKKVDSLYGLLKDLDYPKQTLEVRLQKAIAIDKRNEHHKALPIYLDVLSKAEKYEFNEIVCESNIYLSLIYEKNGDFDLAYTHIKMALEQCRAHHLDLFYSTIFIRLASIHRVIIRNSSVDSILIKRLGKLGFRANLDSTMSLAKQALPYAQRFNNSKDIHDCYFLIGACYSYQKNNKLAMDYFLKAIPYLQKVNDYVSIFFEYSNISMKYLDLKMPRNALRYNDSSFKYYDRITIEDKYIIAEDRAKIFSTMKQTDSAYHYLQFALSEMNKSLENQKHTDIRKLEEQYQNDKKEETIKNQRRQMALVLFLLVGMLLAAIDFVRKNRKIKAQNRVINQQVIDLQKTIEQKQILLSELQHRVKNNLQYVISILEIQKESVNHSNIDDLIRSNQNRIHSIALLHKKLNLNDSVNEVDLCRYINGLAELVKESYSSYQQKVNLYIICDVKTLIITKALPLGLIIVELVSNSMKHAFKQQQIGVINIEITKDEKNDTNNLHYIDNGMGFDFEKIETKGIGLEIIKGLLDQLNASVEAPTHQKGFELIIYFKS
ncbi:MAG: histidine kinase dimerization/phosphoacceptor domain -containing protein [Spirosomataceae bacterium]